MFRGKLSDSHGNINLPIPCALSWRRKWQSSFSILALRTPNSMKPQKDRTLKDELPRSVGAQYATGDQSRNNSRKNEEMEPKQK